jgi:antirestriction protein
MQYRPLVGAEPVTSGKPAGQRTCPLYQRKQEQDHMDNPHAQKGAFEAPQLSTDEQAIQRGIEAARAEDREVDDAVARCIAGQLHGGQASALYSFVTTGSLEHERLDDELARLYRDPNPRVAEWASVLGIYALHREHKGPVDGWATLWPDSNAHDESDDAQARAGLMERINAAAVTTLGQVATIHAANGTYGLDSDERAQPEVDVYPWTDAAHWHPDSGPDELSGPGVEGMPSAVVDELFARTPEAELGSRDGMGWCGLVRHDGRPGGVILRQTQYGRRSAWATESADDLAQAWEEAQREYEAYRDATEANRGEVASGLSPEIWVGSLADYTAGHLHGVWLDATLDPDELAAAIQFMLKNSYESDAEEYGVFDYDGFGEAASLLGEYPSLAAVSKIAQGIAECGEAFAAWAAYVGPEQTEQLDRFEDHYLGEWDSLEAHAEDLLRETEANRVIEEAPEGLRPYLKLDVEGYSVPSKPHGISARFHHSDSLICSSQTFVVFKH